MMTWAILPGRGSFLRMRGPHMVSRILSISAIQFKQESSNLAVNASLHVHPKEQNGLKTYAISFLSSKEFRSPSTLFDHPKLIIGWTPDKNNLDPKTFQDNEQFVQFLNDVLAENIHKINDSSLKGLATWQKEGWMHIGDERNPPPWGRIPSPEDIIGSVLVKDGIIQPNTYQPMPAHRLVTSNGIFQLSEPIQRCVTDAAKNEAQKSN